MLDEEIERKIISMYAKGMTTGDMEAHIQDLYGLDISDSTISRITDKVLPIAKEYPRYAGAGPGRCERLRACMRLFI